MIAKSYSYQYTSFIFGMLFISLRQDYKAHIIFTRLRILYIAFLFFDTKPTAVSEY